MCGIAGCVDFTRDFSTDRAAAADAQAMTDTMACRGPDDEGLWTAPHAALGHRRLAIIDVPGGHQPMTLDVDGETRLSIVYCGEVYNFTELRDRAGAARATGSAPTRDTEVVLHGLAGVGRGGRRPGSTACSPSPSGTPATQVLTLVRDRMGIKPLYYYPTPDGVLFGSEPKAILAHPRAEAVVDLDGLRELLSHVKTPGHGGLPRHARGAARLARARSAATGLTHAALLAARGDRAHRRPATPRRRTSASCSTTSSPAS